MLLALAGLFTILGLLGLSAFFCAKEHLNEMRSDIGMTDPPVGRISIH